MPNWPGEVVPGPGDQIPTSRPTLVRLSTGFISCAPLRRESREIQMGRFGLELGWSTKITRNVRRRSEDTLLCTLASPNRQGDGSGEKGYFYGERSSSDP